MKNAEIKIKQFTLFWLTGHSEIVEGADPASAMNNVGYGAGSLRALDFYANGNKRDEWQWDAKDSRWKSTLKLF